MTFIKIKSWKRVISTVLAGVILLALGFHLLLWPDSQVSLYNQGIQAYRTGQSQEAIQLFDRSLSVYNKRSSDSWLERFVYPSPDQGIASKASFHKAKSLIKLKKGKEAVEAFKESLQFNPGNLNAFEHLDGFDHLTAEEILALHEHAKVVKYDLELLFKNNKKLGEGEGKGKGKPKPGEGDGKKQQPGKQPGDLPGKGDPKEI